MTLDYVSELKCAVEFQGVKKGTHFKRQVKTHCHAEGHFGWVIGGTHLSV